MNDNLLFWISIGAIGLGLYAVSQPSQVELQPEPDAGGEPFDDGGGLVESGDGMAGMGDAPGLANFTYYASANVQRWNSTYRRWYSTGNLSWLNSQMRAPRRIRAYAVVSGSGNSPYGQIVVRGSVLLQGMSYSNALNYASREVTNLIRRAGYTNVRAGATVGDMQSSGGGYNYGAGSW